MLFVSLGPILHPAQMTFYNNACIVASLHPVQSSKLTPLHLRLERCVDEKQSRVPAQMILGAILVIEKSIAPLTKKYLV